MGMTALEAANCLIYMTDGTINDMTNFKLNKLLYYAQGHYLQKYGEPLFREDIRAFDHGPVVPQIYKRYKKNGSQPIHDYALPAMESMDERDTALLFDVALEYGKYSMKELYGMTHAKGTPWAAIYPKDKYGIIPNELILEFFNGKGYRNLEHPKQTYSNDDLVGRVENGVLVLPKEWDDEEW